jgi:uncharacterized DUF497 family protein
VTLPWRTIVHTLSWCDSYGIRLTLGLSNAGNLLVVVYSYQEPDAIQLISAWKANKTQGKAYEKGRR